MHTDQTKTTQGSGQPDPEIIAEQLRKPTGDLAPEVGEKMNEANLHMNLYAIEKLALADNAHVLEVGMGNGSFIGKMLSRNEGVRYTGFDYSPEMVAEVKQRNLEFMEQGRVSFLLGNTEQLPFGDNQFDRILTVNTVYFWEEPGKVLSEFRRVLKPGGKLVIGIRPKAVMENYPFTKHGFTLYSTSELTRLLETAGYEVTDSEEREEPPIEFEGKELTPGFTVICAK